MFSKLKYVVFFFSFSLFLYGQQAKNASATPAAEAPASNVAQSSTDSPKTPEEFFASARQLSDLEAAGIPFHLKATYVATGDAEFTGNGTFEEWWQSKDVWRREATLGDFRWAQIQNGSKLQLYATSDYIPLRLRQMVGALPMLFPSTASAEDDWKMQHRKLNGMKFTVLIQPYMAAGMGHPVNLTRAYYFTSEGLLRILQTGDIATIYNDFQPFQSLTVPRKISIALHRDTLVQVSAETLESLGTDAKTLDHIIAIPMGLAIVPPRPSDDSLVRKTRLIHQPFTNYPKEARAQHIQGTVVIDCTIDSNGTVREPQIVQSAGKLLDDAALEAVRQYQYQPLLVDGKPVTIDTTISSVFSLRY